MKVKEVEELLGITRANIRFYEKEGLLRPERGENGYRCYSKEDVEQLKKIILFRKLGISIPDIMKIFNDEETIAEIISQNILSLNRQIEQIKGAIDVCKRIEMDEDKDVAFDYEKYWSIVEQEEFAGNTFYDNLKDYIEFESSILKHIWSINFHYDLDGSVKKRGWIIALVVLLGICVVRGLSYQFLWKSGSFWYGFSYPFSLLALMSCIALPMYILNYIYKGKEVIEEQKIVKKRKIPLYRLCKILGMIIYFITLLIIIPIFGDKIIYYNVIGRETNYIITGSPFILRIIVALYLCVLPLWLYSDFGIFGNVLEKQKGFKAHLTKSVKKKVLVVSVCIYIVTAIVSDMWYDCITEDGITKRHFFWTRNYSWEDISFYRLSADLEGTFQYTIVMKDRTHISLMGDSSSSNLDEKMYPEGAEDFVLQLTKQFVNQGIALKMDSWEELYKKLDGSYWKEYAEKIRTLQDDD